MSELVPASIIVGSGRGMLFAELLIRQLGAPVAAIAECNTRIHEPLKRRLAEYGSPGTSVVASQQEALARFPDADRVFVVSPNTTHAGQLEIALAANRHVLLEKPVAASRADVDRIEALCRDTDRVVQLGFVLRYSAFYRKVHRILCDGALGRVLMIQMNERLSALHGCTYRRGWRRLAANTGGFLNEKSSHDLDLMCWFKSPDAVPVSVFSVGGRHLFERSGMPERCPECSDPECPYRADDRRIFGQQYQLAVDVEAERRCVYRTDADVLNHQHVTVVFSDGAHGHLGLTATSGEEARDLMIHGTRGFLRGTLNDGRLELMRFRRDSRWEDCSVNASDMHGGGDAAIIEDFFDCIAGRKTPEATVADGIRATRLALAADESVRTGQCVAL